MNFNNFKSKLLKSAIFKDSFWAVFGNGLGTGLLLIAGIIIARYLGKDLYGEYGVVKTNMFYLAGFSTFGLGFTSTRFISKYLKEDPTKINGVISTSLKITLIFSSIIAVSLCFCSNWLSDILNDPGLGGVFRCLAVVIVIKALATTSIGILSGLRKFKIIAKNLIISGVMMLMLCTPLTFYWGLTGALVSLTCSQLIVVILNYIVIKSISRKQVNAGGSYEAKELIKFSCPVAMQEISYSICGWLGTLSLAKWSTMGEVGIYSATAQWNAVIMFIPGLLHNVFLSHLSQRNSRAENKNKLKQLLTINLVCTAIPFIVVYFLSSFIASFYGPQFDGMIPVLRVLTFATIPACCSDVFKSELLAVGKPWLLFIVRCIRDLGYIILVVWALIYFKGQDGALIYAYSTVASGVLFFIMLFFTYLHVENKEVLEN